MRTTKEETKQDYAKRMDRVLEHIQTHLDEPLALKELAAIACFSPYHFHRIFSGMIGESVKSHIRRLRLERAAITLKHGDACVTDIALSAGFETHESFTRAFTSMFGLSPRQFRDAHHGGIERKHSNYWKEIVMEASVNTLEAMDVVFVRHVGPYKDCHQAWSTLCGFADGKGLFTPSARVLAVCHDDPDVTPEDKIRYDACITVAGPVEVQAPVGMKTIAGGRYAKTLHKGPHSELHRTYAWLCGQWAPQNGHEADAGASIEIYLNTPDRTAPEALLTEVYVPLK
ncbi:helix-turn-helix domain-containing protein [Pseudodesulfovibrio sp. F-1]|uniref:Helix-turn-helix domain-containing protein n=1 Tax=Pseudodesulfovibrio alkaliphilus TaxID=2661613 RepID=A0A7K1KLF8_9BACT|nr:AraC family transcriptional regulator [Pseudodesulfovibrio alkaliphilus]MUM76732.1 helix-turn-helix domain-containing protein [Pseudodesulfovibrio alkaliphilus]